MRYCGVLTAAGAALAFGTCFAAETLNRGFGETGTPLGVGSQHFEAQGLVGANKGTVLFDVAFSEGKPPLDTCRAVMTLRTSSRTRVAFYTCDANRTLLCSLTDNAGEHTWRVQVPKIRPDERVQLGVTWDGTVVRGYLNGRVFASGVQPIPVEKVTQLHFGPYKDGWMVGSPWADDIRLFGVKVSDEALSPEKIAADYGLTIRPLDVESPMLLTIPAVPPGVAAPTVDGRADDAAWNFAASMPQLIIGNFPGKSGQIPEHGFKVLYDNENLYLTFKSRFPGNVSVIEGEERTAKKEPALWGTESFEFRFSAGGHAYCFGGNVAGGTSEGRDEDYTWDVPWTYRVSKAMNIDDTVLWRGELSIPWKSLGLSQQPKELPLNFCRSWKLPAIGCHTSLHLQGGSYTDVDRFVRAVLAPTPAYELVERTNPSEGTYREKYTIRSVKGCKAEYEIALASLDGKLPPMTGVRRAYGVKPGEPVTDEMTFATGIPGYDALVHTLTADGKVVMREIVPYRLDDKFFFAHPYLLANKIEVVVKNVMLKLKYGGEFKAKVVLTDPDGSVKASVDVTGDQVVVPFSQKWPVGAYALSLVGAADGKALDTVKIDYPGLGDWAKQDFHADKVLPPFKPLMTTVKRGACDAVKTSFSDRSYGWKDSLLLSSAVSRGRELFEKGAEIRIGGLPVKATSFKLGRSTETRLEFAGKGDNVSLTGWSEYDGCNFNRLTVKGAEGKSLSIRFTLPSDVAKFLHGARGGAWGLKTTSEVPFGETKLHYYPVLWLSDQEKGMCFFTESRIGWNASEKTCFTITRGKKETVVDIAVMDRLPADFSFEFGFMASPIRPLAANHPYNPIGATWALPLNRPGRIPNTFAAMLASEKYKGGGVVDTASSFGDQDDASGRRWGWVMSKIFEECRPHPEASPFPYNDARWLSVRYREVGAYLNDWKLVPELALDNEGTGHFMYDLCPTTLASDYWMSRLRAMLKRYPEQRGIYCDFGTVKECSNEGHGCKGAIPLIAYREFVRRMAAVQTDFYTNVPIVVLHNTDCIQLPCLAFASHLYNGEQVRQASTAMLHNKRDILDNYGLDMFGLELSTLPIGVCNGPYFPFDRLTEKNGGDEEDAPYKFRMEKAAFAGCLTHGHFPAQSRGHFGIFDKVFRVYEDFGVGKPETRFVGYWHNPATVTLSNPSNVSNPSNPSSEVVAKPPSWCGETPHLRWGGVLASPAEEGFATASSVYVSCYTDGRKVLAVIGHIGKEHEDKDVEIRFDANVLGLKGALAKAVDTMTRPDQDYQWLFDQAKRCNVPPWRCPIIIGEFGTRVDGFDGKTLKYHLPFHTYGIVELVP